MDSRIREALEAKAFDTIIRCRPARVVKYEDALALLTAEPEPCPVRAEPELPTHPGGYSGSDPEPCESSNYSDIPNSSRLPEHYGAGDLVDDLREDERSSSGRMEAPREYVLSYPESCSLVNRYASQVADKRAEELRAQVETLREAISDAIHSSSKSYKDSLGRMHSLEGDDGEQSRILSFDGFNGLEIALAATEPKP